ncbi:molybdopterin-binding protein [Selenihalanaerobacter shriftii]|uniref:Molybdopterin molybdenumtransferase n=1 Tax=Selenihalanaerobacter shriftii TaxID=142842 RepID=A0A1T4JTK0_9FIRM|nr:molybdopterin-binding protein [Selenihalanaerobacter shriftii]SJZ33387.1 molybdenum cofactor synthesis domain-containing protein [Selenihalanaerobacter shriftii]
MKKVPVKEAVGMVLGHDMTQIIPGEFKGVKFEKGHIIKEEDIPVLKSMGKNHIYSFELGEDQCHEEEAAERIAKAVQGENIKLVGPSEGKMNLVAKNAGVLKVNEEALREINSFDDLILATLHNNTTVEEGQNLAGTRINPLVIESKKIDQVEAACEKITGDIMSVNSFHQLKVGIIITGSEVYSGEIEDKFAPVFRQKINDLNAGVLGVNYAPDDPELIKEEIFDLIEKGADVVVTGGGMSVDPDDVTPVGIKKTGAKIETYGAPVLPGSMFMLAYLDEIPILGIPACGMYNKSTVFDLVFPRILTKERVMREDIIEMAHGGLCLQCDVCRYPACSFGK